MKIHWFGHCSFLLQDSFGRRILTDPYDLDFSKEIIKLNPEVITLSHEHTKEISSFFKSQPNTLIDDAIIYQNTFFKIEGFSEYHDKVNGLKRGPNNIYLYYFDNMRICHLGHLGHILSDELIKYLGNIDILFIPIGGQFTLDSYDASILCKKIKPKLIIPMQFKNKESLVFLDGPKKFLSLMNNVIIPKEKSIDSNCYLIHNTSKTLLLKSTKILCY